MVKHLPVMRKTWVWSLGREDPLRKDMATHFSTLAWKIPWTEEPRRLQSMGSQRVGHDWATTLTYFTYTKGILLNLCLNRRALREWHVSRYFITIFLEYITGPLNTPYTSNNWMNEFLVREYGKCIMSQKWQRKHKNIWFLKMMRL